MATKGNRFGTFKGVFTPSILTILGVIMYLRLPWIVGQAGLWSSLAIVLVAHLISATTGLSVSSIATDKKVETGGSYYMISRSLGLPIGGTLGLALFVGLSFSVSLYLIGFSETFLSAFGFEVTIQNIRIAGSATLLIIAIVTFISTSLALKTQLLILLIMALSLLSIFWGRHEVAPGQEIAENVSGSLPWIALFAIFFPAVTGFEAGVSMSGDLKDPKKSIPGGTMIAILVGLAVYLALVIFLYLRVSPGALVNDPAVLNKISLFAPLVVAGVWGATLSSALGSILGAPRILQAMASDRIGPRWFARGSGAGNEPRNALIITFFIALGGILIGELNVIARVVSVFFIMTYGFLNLTCAIESWAGSDFRPAFRIPPWVSVIGALACLMVMIQLDFIAMVGATLVLGTIFLLLKRMELQLQSGDTWLGFWSSLVKHGLFKLLTAAGKSRRNWRPNIILFSGGIQERPHLIDMGRTLVGKLGVFTNFKLIGQKSEGHQHAPEAKNIIETDHAGKKVISRYYSCSDIYHGMELIGGMYGFPGFEPNTILMGWAQKEKIEPGHLRAIQHLAGMNYNLVFYRHRQTSGEETVPQIDFWWSGNSRNLHFGLALLKFITTDPAWRGLRLRILVINYRGSKTDSIYAFLQQALYQARLTGSVVVINNSVEKLAEKVIIRAESDRSALTLLEPNPHTASDTEKWMADLKPLIGVLGNVLVLHSGKEFESISLDNQPETSPRREIAEDRPLTAAAESLAWPDSALLSGELRQIAQRHEVLQNSFVENGYKAALNCLMDYHTEILNYTARIRNQMEKAQNEKEETNRGRTLIKLQSEFAYQIRQRLEHLRDQLLIQCMEDWQAAQQSYLQQLSGEIRQLPDKLYLQYDSSDYIIDQGDAIRIVIFKVRKRLAGLLHRGKIKQRLNLQKAADLLLYRNRLGALEQSAGQFGLATITYANGMRLNLVEISEHIDKAVELQAEKTASPETNIGFWKEIDAQLDQAGEALSSTAAEIAARLREDLFANLGNLASLISVPEAGYLLKPYNKKLRKRKADELEALPERWFNNLRLYLNKSYAEFLIIGIQHRFWHKLHKWVEEIERSVESRFYRPIRSAEQILKSCKMAPGYADVKQIGDMMRDIKQIDTIEDFNSLLKDLRELTVELPDQIEINDDQFFNELEQGNFAESQIRTVDFRRKAEFYFGTGLINRAAAEAEQTSAKLEEIITKSRDTLRLAVFNLENLIIENKENTDAELQPRAEELIDGILRELEYQLEKARELLKNTDSRLKEHLIASIEPFRSLVQVQSVSERTSTKRIKRNAVVQLLSGKLAEAAGFFREQSVKLLYSQSEGIMFVQRLSAFESEHKINNQAIQEMLETLTPNKKTLRDVPFYYLSLFSGSSAISEDLWVGHNRELEEAARIVNRHKSGYPGALLITGPRNSGKTSLSKLIALKYLPKHTLHLIQAPKGGSVDTEAFKQTIRKSLGTDTDAHQYLLNTTEQHVLIFNDLELWWERHPDGQQVVKEIIAFMREVQQSCFTIVNCGLHAYQIMQQVLNIEPAFMGRIICQPSDAEDLKEMALMRHRMGGLKISLNGKWEEELTEWHLARLFNRYFRLSGGNPGYTLQAWLANVVKVSGNTVYIKTPVIPQVRHLVSMSEDLWFVILQFTIHRRCTVARLARVLRQSEERTTELIAELLRNFLVEERFPGVYAINAYLEPFLIQILEEKDVL